MTTTKVAIVISAAAFRSVNLSGPSVGLVKRPRGFTCRHIGSTSYSILPSRMGDHGVCWEKTENMEKMENINQMTLFMIQNKLFVTQTTLFGNQMTQKF